MKHFLSVLLLFLVMVQGAFAQNFALKGKLVDKTSGEGLAGATIQIKNETTNTGGLSEVNGSYKIENLKPGTYNVTASYIGYVAVTEKVVISDKDVTLTMRLGEDNSTLNEVEIVADVAVERETPVAFSAIKESTIRESLGGRDLPLILNETPGVYATQTGGGVGDSRISIRGFSQENIAVMVNGVPVNDMENGSVFWSNWDLGDVTKSTQIQRGLSASKLATPSVGGTLNILTRGYEKDRRLIARQELGSNNYAKTSLMLSSGTLKGDWSVTVFGSRRTGDGWVEGTFDDSYSYFANISKKIGKHTFSLTGLGSPQKHGQRSFAKTIATYDADKAKDLGANTLDPITKEQIKGRGFDYNSHWGSVDRYTISGNDTTHNRQDLNEKQNYYHKPQFTLNHFWNISDKLFMSNVIYASLGNGGAVSSLATIASDETGHPAFQALYNANYKNKLSSNLLRTLTNNHRWYGFISGLDYKITDRATLSVGVDGRTYKGEHYSSVYDLLGGDYTTEKDFAGTRGNFNADPATKLYKGDKLGFNYNGYVKSIGGFAMMEYKTTVLSAFVSGTVTETSYKRKDLFAAKIYNIDVTQNGETNTIERSIVYGGGIKVPKIYRSNLPASQPKDTTIIVNYNSPVSYNNVTYERKDENGKFLESDWVKRTGYTIKGGLNYNLNEYNNVFFNLGYINKTPFLKFIFDTRTGEKIKDPHNEGVISFELGYGVNRGSFKANLNAYHTTWKDRSISRAGTGTDPDGNQVSVVYNLSGMDARHVGVELDIAQEISRKVELNAAISLGDWRWNSTGTARIVTADNVDLGTSTFNVKGVHVGGSAQNQFMIGLRYEPIEGLYFRPTYLMFMKNYADFDPSSSYYSVEGATPQDAFRLPTSRNVDFHAGYSFKVYKDAKLTLNGSVLNVLNEFYISDVPTRSGINPFDPNAIEVFFNSGRRFVIGASVTL